MTEAERERLGAHLGELVGRVVALQRQVLPRRSQVLADRQNVAVDGAQVAEGLQQLLACLAEPDHDRALGMHRVTEALRHLLCPANHLERTVVAGALAHRALQPLHGFNVVVKDVGGRLHHGEERLLAPVKVGNQHLDAGARGKATQLTNRLGEDAGAAVGKVVAGDARYHHMIKVERGE